MFWSFTLYQLTEAGKEVDVVTSEILGGSAIAYYGKYGYLGCTVIASTQALMGIGFVPYGFYCLRIYQDEDPDNKFEMAGLVCDKVYHHANGYTYLSFRHATWLALNQICNYNAVTSDKLTPEPELVKQLFKNLKKFEVIDAFDVSNKFGEITEIPVATRDITNYEVVGKRWVDVLDEVCYRNRWEWYIVREKSNQDKYSICLGKFPVAFTLKQYGADLQAPDIGNQPTVVPSVFPLTSGAHKETLTTIQEVDSFNLVQYNTSYFQYINDIPNAATQGPDVITKYFYEDGLKYIVPVPQLVFINVSKQSLLTSIYNSNTYISPWEYFRVMCPQNEFARERFHDFERIMSNVASQPTHLGRLEKTSGREGNISEWKVKGDTGGPGETLGKYEDNKKAVFVPHRVMSPWAGSNFGMFFPEPMPADRLPGEVIVLKVGGDQGKSVVIGQLVPSGNPNIGVQKDKGDFLLKFGDGSNFHYSQPNGDFYLYAYNKAVIGVATNEEKDENGNAKPGTGIPDAMLISLDKNKKIIMGAQNSSDQEAIVTKSHKHSILPAIANLICIPGSAPAPAGQPIDTDAAKADTSGKGISTKILADAK